ncbi:MAG: SBBP repeat-containing protein [Acidobacteria bacterium]|nr:SBBP repeat-containing protein [Acidobacteriota bacterium]
MFAKRRDQVVMGLFLFILLETTNKRVNIATQYGGACLSSVVNSLVFGLLGASEISFERNLGQSDPHYQYLSRTGGYLVFLAGDEVALDLGRQGQVLRMRLLDASDASRLEPFEPLPGRIHYLLGNDPARWITDVPTYARVRWANIYPGIDVVYYGRRSGLEHDFVIAPGADPSRIRMAFDGADQLRLTPEGDLVLQAGRQEVLWRKPAVYQPAWGGRRTIEGRYRLGAGGQVGFDIPAWDRGRPLVIDPVVTYATYAGRRGDEAAFHLAVDSSGNTYLAGFTTSPDYPRTPGTYSSGSPFGPGNVVVTKMNAAGTAIVYSTHLGGSQQDAAFGIAVDAAGNVYITGSTSSADFPVTEGAIQTRYGGPSGDPPGFGDCFVAKLNAAGNALVYSTYLGGSGPDGCRGLAVDAAGNAYVTGATSGSFPTTANAFQRAYRGTGDSGDAFVAKLNAAGSALLYSTYFGGRGPDWGLALALDAAGNAYVTGLTRSSDLPVTPAAFQRTFGGAGGQPDIAFGDAFVLKLNPEGTAPVYCTYLGGRQDDAGLGIAVDSQGNAYVTGNTLSSNFPVTPQAYQAAYAGAGGDNTLAAGDVFVTKLNPAGSELVYSTFLGGSQDDRGLAIAIDSAGNAYVTGNTLSPNFPTTSDARQTTNRGSGFNNFIPLGDAFLAQLNASGRALVYSTYLGGGGDDLGAGVVVDRSGNIYVAGSTSSPDFPVTTGATQTGYGGGTQFNFPLGDGFVVRFGEPPPPQPPPPPAPPPANLPLVNAVLNGASFATGAPGVTPGSIATLFGERLAASTASAAATPLPTSLGGASVTIGGRAAPLFYASPGQVNAQIPYETPLGQAQVVVTVGGVASSAATVNIVAAAPGIFTFGANRAVVQNQDFTVNTADNPARVDSIIVVYLTGGGGYDNRAQTGVPSPADPLVRVASLAFGATIGGQPAEVLFLGLTPGLIGVLQANLRVPGLASGTYPLVLTVGGVASNAPVVTVTGN